MLISGSARSSSLKVVPPLLLLDVVRRFRSDLHQAARAGARRLVAELGLGVDHGGDQRGVDFLFVGLLADHVLVAQRQGQLLHRMVEGAAGDQDADDDAEHATATAPSARRRRRRRLPCASSPQLVEQGGQRPLEVLDRAVVLDHVLGPGGLLLLGRAGAPRARRPGRGRGPRRARGAPRRRRRRRRWCRRPRRMPASNSSGTSTTATSVSAGSEAARRRSARRPAGGSATPARSAARGRRRRSRRSWRGRHCRSGATSGPQRSINCRAAARIRAARGRPRRWRASPRQAARKPRAPRTSRPRCRR